MKILSRRTLMGLMVITTMIVAAVHWLVPGVIKSQIENRGSQAIGSEISVAGVELSYLPLGITLHGVAIADAKDAMRNMLEFKSASFDLELLALITARIIIHELSVVDLELGTERSMAARTIVLSGEDEQSSDDSESGMLDGLSMQMPSVKEIIANEELKTDLKVREWQALVAEKKEQDVKLRSELPGSKKMNTYQQQIEVLQAKKPKSLEEYKQLAADLKKIKADLNRDKELLANAKTHYSRGAKELGDKLLEVKSAPGEDWERLSRRYSFDSSGAMNLSRHLLDAETLNTISQFMGYYQQLQPYLQTEGASEVGDKGADDNNSGEPQLKFVIYKSAISVLHEIGDFEVLISDFTHQQGLLGRPTTLLVDAEGLRRAEHLKINGLFDMRSIEGVVSEMQYNLVGLDVEDMSLGGGSVPITIATAQADVKGSLNLLAEEVKGGADGQFRDLKFTPPQSKSGMQGEMGALLKSIDQFDFQVNLSGSLPTPDIKISSDLDQQISTKLKGRLKEKQGVYETELKGALNEKLTQGLGDNQTMLKTLQDGEKSSSERLQMVQELLKSQIADYKDQQLQQGKDEIKGKLMNKLRF